METVTMTSKPGSLCMLVAVIGLITFAALDQAQGADAPVDVEASDTTTEAAEAATEVADTSVAEEAPVSAVPPPPVILSDPVDEAPVIEADEADASAAMDDLLGSREDAPVIEPVGSGQGQPETKFITPASATVDIDPAVLGIAPGDEPPKLRREGEFIIDRRGRMIRSPESGHLLYVLESDSQNTPELPLVMQACQLLETMENTIDRRGDTTVFIVSGQIHTYRGANYLLPTMMKTAADTGNLTN